MSARGRDVRLLGAVIVASIVALGGAAIALVPGAAKSLPPATHDSGIDTAFRQGVVMLHARQYGHALTAFHRVLEFAPEMPEAQVNMGFALVGLGRHREALAFFEGALALRPRQDNAYYGLALAARALGDIETARGAMRTYVHLAPPGDPHRRRAEAALLQWSKAKGGTAIAPSGASIHEARP